MGKTVKSHLDETSEIKRHLDEGDALVVKLRKELSTCREAIEWMNTFGHPDFKKSISQYSSFSPGNDKEVTMKAVGEFRVKAINEILGDRA